MDGHSFHSAVILVGLMNGLMGFDPATMAALSAATGATGEMDNDMAEKLAAMSASMNMMEDLQLRSKMLEELYGRAATSAALGGDLTAATAAAASAAAGASTSASKEPGGTTPSPAPSHSSAPTHSARGGGKHRKSATVTKAAVVEPAEPEDQPEDLSMKSSSKADAGSEGRISRESILRDETNDKQSELGEDRQSRLSEPLEGRNSRLAEERPQSSTSADGRVSRTSRTSEHQNDISERIRSASPPPDGPADQTETENNEPDKPRPESPDKTDGES